MTAGFAGTTDTTNVRAGAAGAQWAVVVGCNPHPNPLPEGEGTCRGQEPRTQPFRPSTPCALRCRARWIPAFAGMTGPGAGTSDTTLPPLRRVCAPLSRTLDSSLRWNDGAWRGEHRTQPFRSSAPCALRCRVRWIPAFAGMTGPGAGTTDTTLPPLRPVCAPLSRTLDSSLRWNDGAWRGERRTQPFRSSAPCALRCRARWIPAFAGMTGAWRGERRTQPFRSSAPCALRCRARWIPAFAGMTGPGAGTTYATNVKVGVAMGQWGVVVWLGGTFEVT